ncbi:MAG: class I SAM-dependent methyltransferase [Bdellovibrionales bacterium]|nr:class I SAM-dependent methyltransferase [Bdellovibrionales bacterium]
MNHPVKNQYERFPYPPIPWLALPRFTRLDLENAVSRRDRLEDYFSGSTEQVNALILGSGTFEPAGVATEYPEISSILAIDLSRENLSRLQKRMRLARLFRKVPKFEVRECDFENEDPSGGRKFQWIRASNVLHHLRNPEVIFERIHNWLSDDGVVRFSVYPRSSRLGMRWLSKHFRQQNVDPAQGKPQFMKAIHQALNQLSSDDPRLQAWEDCIEKGHISGIIDAFFHAHENTVTLYDWVRLFDQAGFHWLGEGTNRDDQTSRIVGSEPLTILDRARLLQAMDDWQDLGSNPVFWIRKKTPEEKSNAIRWPELASVNESENWKIEHNELRNRANFLAKQVPSLTVQKFFLSP